MIAERCPLPFRRVESQSQFGECAQEKSRYKPAKMLREVKSPSKAALPKPSSRQVPKSKESRHERAPVSALKFPQ